MEVTKADFYALREFLDREYASNPRFVSTHDGGWKATKQMFGGQSYLFTHVNRDDNGGYDFQLRKSKAIVLMYDLVNFNYQKGNITVEKCKIKDDEDKGQVQGLVSLLKNRIYGSIISNLDELAE